MTDERKTTLRLVQELSMGHPRWIAFGDHLAGDLARLRLMRRLRTELPTLTVIERRALVEELAEA